MLETTTVRDGIEGDLDVGGLPGLDGPRPAAVPAKTTLEVA